jgi:hypothetical protein
MWYWYITGSITTITFLSLIINYMLVTGFMNVVVRRPHKQQLNIVYNWEDHTGPIERKVAG